MSDLKARIGERRHYSPGFESSRKGPPPSSPSEPMTEPLISRIAPNSSNFSTTPIQRPRQYPSNGSYKDRYFSGAGKSSTDTSLNGTRGKLFDRISDVSPVRPSNGLFSNKRDSTKLESRHPTDAISPGKASDTRSSEEMVSMTSLRTDKPPLPKNQSEHSAMPQGTLLQDTLLPLVMQNAQRRESVGQVFRPEEMNGRLREALTKEICETLAKRMRSIRQQMQELNSSGVDAHHEADQLGAARSNAGGALLRSRIPSKSGSALLESGGGVNAMFTSAIPDTVPSPVAPRAPRAMRQVTKQTKEPPILRDSVLSHDRNNDFVFGGQPQDVRLNGHNTSVMKANDSMAQGVVTPSANRMPKPVELSDNAAITKNHGVSTKYDASPSTIRRYPLSSSRSAPVPYRMRQDQAANVSSSVSRSRHHHSRSRSPNARSRRAEDSISSSQLHNHSYHSSSRRSGSSDTYHRRSSPRRMPERSTSPTSRSPTSQPRAPNFLDRKSRFFSHAEYKQPVRPSHPPSYQNIPTSDTFDQPFPVLHYDEGRTTTPVSMTREESEADDSTAVHHSSSAPTPQKSVEPIPCHNVPGLWLEKAGRDQADVLECEFPVDSETALKWGIPDLSAPRDALNSKLCLQLLCLHKDQIQTIRDSLRSATVQERTNALGNLKIEWPSQGSLIVQMNPANKQHGRSWLPHYLAPTSPALDVTDHVGEGQNVLRLIQLDDMADKVFVLYATPSCTQVHIENVQIHTHSGLPSILGLRPATVEVMF